MDCRPTSAVCGLVPSSSVRDATQVLQLFDETRHELLLQRISAMNLQPLPPVLNTTSARWLGDRPGFY